MHGEGRVTKSDEEKKRKGELPSKEEEDDGERSFHRHFLHLQHRLCLALLLLFLPCVTRSATTVIPLLCSPSSCFSLLDLTPCSALLRRVFLLAPF
ncbi:hypothetical protein HN873_030107 [Arachis hypogaea]